MVESLLRELHGWMNRYIQSFYTDDAEIQEAIRLKEEHTGYVTSIARALAKHLSLTERDCRLAEIIGLFHDVGRFRQFSVYRTFNDAESEDHAALGLRVMDEEQLWEKLDKEEGDILRYAIFWHNKKEIVEKKSPRHLLFARLIRDADKLDIYRVLRPSLTAPTDEGISPDFLEKFNRGEQVDYTRIRTQEDRKLVRLMWVYDVNFAWTLKNMVERHYIRDIIQQLPKNCGVEAGVERLLAYVNHKCAENDIVEM